MWMSDVRRIYLKRETWNLEPALSSRLYNTNGIERNDTTGKIQIEG